MRAHIALPILPAIQQLARRLRIRLPMCLGGICAAALVGTAAQAQSLPDAVLGCKQSPGPTSQEASAVTVQFFGTASLLITDGRTSIMTDGFLTRPGKLNLLFARIAPDRARIDDVLKRAKISKIDAIFVSHSHFDHALDSAAVAARTGAVLVGSASTRNVALSKGDTADEDTLAPERIKVFSDRDVFSFGEFRITVFSSQHSPKPWFPGDVTAPFSLPARVGSYKEGGSYAFLVEHPRARILVVPSANDVKDPFPATTADAVFLSIGTLGKQSDDFADTYWNQTVRKSGARMVIPIHWDDFTVKLTEPLRDMPQPFDNVSRGKELLRKLADKDGIEVRYLAAFEEISLPKSMDTKASKC